MTQKQPFSRRFKSFSGSILALGTLLLPASQQVARAAAFNQATVQRIVEGREVFIDRVPARVHQTARLGQQLSTGKSRAEVLFDRRAIGFLGKNSLITLGQQCIRLQSGTLLVNGPQDSCMGSRVLGVRGTTYVLTVLPDGGYELSVLNGEAYVGAPGSAAAAGGPDPSAPPSILSLYPRLNPVFDLGVSAFGSNAGGLNIGQAEGLVLGDVGFFLPLSQGDGTQLLYNYTRANSNVDGFSGVSSEIGYRWFDPNNQSLNGGLIGYDGWQSPGCFHSQLSVGAEWERNRWQFSALGGIPLDNCLDSLGFVTAGVGIPVINLGRQSVLLGLSPYLLSANGLNYGGGRLSLDIPIGSQVNLQAYGQVDDLLGTTIGGQLRLRFSAGRGFVSDPNARPASARSPLPWQSRGPGAGSSNLIAQSNPLTIPADAVRWQPAFTATSEPAGSIAQLGAQATVAAGERATLDANGTLLRKAVMTREQYEALIEGQLKGQKLLPESMAIGMLYQKKFKNPSASVLAITGLNWYDNSLQPMPRQRGANTLVVPQNKLPKPPEPVEVPEPESRSCPPDTVASSSGGCYPIAPPSSSSSSSSSGLPAAASSAPVPYPPSYLAPASLTPVMTEPALTAPAGIVPTYAMPASIAPARSI